MGGQVAGMPDNILIAQVTAVRIALAPNDFIADDAHGHIAVYRDLAGQARVAETGSELVMPVDRRWFTRFKPDAACRTDAAPAAIGHARDGGIGRETDI